MKIQEIQEDLTSLKGEIDAAKTDIAKLDGREAQLLTQLEQNHGLSSAEQIQSKVKKLTEQTEKDTKQIEKDYTKLKEEYAW